ncbi:MAG: metallophosphoesterase [Candidatus Komeilibacteria bacterium CG_4_10_14_0_2_um_filter_37_10]|uniref:Metallophosphoesterase n=1 Tax=Candidatus Komeilibacteria bacterium CG_4_10_14_0_2_um_filter_37_10 TaxID=1974470 RepID=A0A2M7VGD0_9BACT|nr:MAG: metallophosphoesterase [Candidatus Komeilibacteria bacterium CG_4_10_14_0_2_um_filter_37_10]
MPAKKDSLKIIFFGDIMGKIGRLAIAQIMPLWQKKYHPDLWGANVENIAHGKGVTQKTLQEMADCGIDFMTSGNHVWRKEDANVLAKLPQFNLVTPENDPRTPAGQGYKLITVKKKKLLVINLLGQEAMTFWGDDSGEKKIKSPFATLDQILHSSLAQEANYSFVDFHAELTSETRALGWHADGRINALIGTHTHIPTADAQILPQGTAYLTDVGMVGAYESVLGISKDIIVDRFLNQSKIVFSAPEKGNCEINAVLLELNSLDKNQSKIKLLRQMIVVK